MRATRYRIVTSVVAALAAASAPPLDAHAAHGVELIERQTSGLAGAPTDLWLQARVDGAGAADAPLGEVAFRVDRRQLDPSAIDELVSAPAGTRLGFAIAGPSRNQRQAAMSKTGVMVEPATREPVVTA